MMIRYSKWIPASESLKVVLDAASELGLEPTVMTMARKTKGKEEVLCHAVFVDDRLLRENLGITERELEEE